MPSSENTAKAILHVDGDAFFASVEESLDPSLKGKPVITGKERGIAASMNYEAKRRGVTRAMTLREVKRVCPDCVILPNDYETYSLVSKRLFTILKRFTPEVEEASIDEGYADITGLRRPLRMTYEEIALKMKETVKNELGIPVSIGLGSSKTIAKICSKWKKPDGFYAVRGEHDLTRFLAQVSASQVCGIGPNTTALLGKHGIYTALDYVSRPEPVIRKLMGKIGSELWRELRGEYVYPVSTAAPPPQASLSKVKTFTPPTDDAEFVRAQLLRNLESAFIKLRRHGLRTSNIYVFLRDSDFRGYYAGAELTRPTSSTLEVAAVAAALLVKIFKKNVRYRQTGVAMNRLTADGDVQLDLFEDGCRAKAMRRLSMVADQVNARFGKHTLHLASTDVLGRFQQHLGDRGDLAGRKVELIPGETFRQHINIPVWKIAV